MPLRPHTDPLIKYLFQPVPRFQLFCQIYDTLVDFCATFHNAELRVAIIYVMRNCGPFVSVHNAIIPQWPEMGFLDNSEDLDNDDGWWHIAEGLSGW